MVHFRFDGKKRDLTYITLFLEVLLSLGYVDVKVSEAGLSWDEEYIEYHEMTRTNGAGRFHVRWGAKKTKFGTSKVLRFSFYIHADAEPHVFDESIHRLEDEVRRIIDAMEEREVATIALKDRRAILATLRLFKEEDLQVLNTYFNKRWTSLEEGKYALVYDTSRLIIRLACEAKRYVHVTFFQTVQRGGKEYIDLQGSENEWKTILKKIRSLLPRCVIIPFRLVRRK